MDRKIILASVGAVALASSALAAEPPPAPPPYLPPPPIFTWTGIYVGGQVGYAWTRSFGQRPDGVIGGANVGYNYEINQWPIFSSSGVVIGLEGTVDGTSLSGGFSDVFAVTGRSRSDIQGSIRGRVGLAWDRALIYATGGAAFGAFQTDISSFGTIPLTGAPFFGSTSISTTRVGWTVGGGIQYAVTNNWSVRAEYRFTDFGTINEALFSGQLPGASIIGNRRIHQNQVQAGIDYKFDWGYPASILAKY